jgi:hypothetical protein
LIKKQTNKQKKGSWGEEKESMVFLLDKFQKFIPFQLKDLDMYKSRKYKENDILPAK